MIGVNHRATKNQKDTIKAVSPVRPPLLIPVADSAQHRIQMISRVMHLDWPRQPLEIEHLSIHIPQGCEVLAAMTVTGSANLKPRWP